MTDLSPPETPSEPDAPFDGGSADGLPPLAPVDGDIDRSSAAAPDAPSTEPAQGMIPGRMRRRTKVERASMRVLATGGIIGIATALGAVLVANDVTGWIVGLAVGLTS